MESRAAPASAPPGHVALDSLWLETLRRIADRAAHELKGALNGVALNVEVVRSRVQRPNTAVSELAKYADATATQLDAVIAMSEALLSLTRRSKSPVELASVVRQMAVLLGSAARSDCRSFELGAVEDLGATSAPADAVRTAIGASLLAAIERSAAVRCTSGGGTDASLRVECDGAVVAPETVAAVAEAGVRISSDSGGILISFPR